MEERAIVERVYRRLNKPNDVIIHSADILIRKSPDLYDFIWYEIKDSPKTYNVIYLRDHRSFVDKEDADKYISAYLMEEFIKVKAVNDHERMLVREMLHLEWTTIMKKIQDGEICQQIYTPERIGAMEALSH